MNQTDIKICLLFEHFLLDYCSHALNKFTKQAGVCSGNTPDLYSEKAGFNRLEPTSLFLCMMQLLKSLTASKYRHFSMNS